MRRLFLARVAALLAVASVAFLVVTLIGMTAEHAGHHRGYQANTRTQRVLSFLFLASLILRRAENRCSLPAFRRSLAFIPSLVLG